MTWFRVDDGFAFHEKSVAAGNAAIGLWVRAGAWSSQQLTDGVVPDHMVTMLGTMAQANALVRVGLWLREQGGYRFWQWDERNPRREQVERDRSAARQRMQRLRSPEVRANSARTSAFVRDPRPDPTRPVPAVGLVGGEEDDVDGTTHQGPEQVYVDDDHEEVEPIRRTLRAVVEGWGDTVPEGLVS